MKEGPGNCKGLRRKFGQGCNCFGRNSASRSLKTERESNLVPVFFLPYCVATCGPPSSSSFSSAQGRLLGSLNLWGAEIQLDEDPERLFPNPLG